MRKTIITLTTLFLFCIPLSAQLLGPLSGTITAGNYMVVGEISVQAGNSLFIEHRPND